MKTLVSIACLVAISSTLIGCSAHLYSPPARIAPLESSKPVAEDKTSGGISVGNQGEIFGLNAASATMRVRHGVSQNFELGLDANLMMIDDSEAAADVDPAIWSARVGGKWAPEPLGGHVALIYGVGGGTSDGGQFVSPDLGVVMAFENRYVVPFLSADAFVSEPVNARPVDISTEDEGLGTNIMTASITWGATFAGGLKVPIETGGSTISPFIGLTRGVMTDGEEDAQIFGGSVGVDMTFE